MFALADWMNKETRGRFSGDKSETGDGSPS